MYTVKRKKKGGILLEEIRGRCSFCKLVPFHFFVNNKFILIGSFATGSNKKKLFSLVFVLGTVFPLVNGDKNHK